MYYFIGNKDTVSDVSSLDKGARFENLILVWAETYTTYLPTLSYQFDGTVNHPYGPIALASYGFGFFGMRVNKLRINTQCRGFTL